MAVALVHRGSTLSAPSLLVPDQHGRKQATSLLRAPPLHPDLPVAERPVFPSSSNCVLGAGWSTSCRRRECFPLPPLSLSALERLPQVKQVGTALHVLSLINCTSRRLEYWIDERRVRAHDYAEPPTCTKAASVRHEHRFEKMVRGQGPILVNFWTMPV